MWDFDEKDFMMGHGGKKNELFNTLEEARSQIDALGSAAQKLETDLAVAKSGAAPGPPAKSLPSMVRLRSQDLVTSHKQI